MQNGDLVFGKVYRHRAYKHKWRATNTLRTSSWFPQTHKSPARKQCGWRWEDNSWKPTNLAQALKLFLTQPSGSQSQNPISLFTRTWLAQKGQQVSPAWHRRLCPPLVQNQTTKLWVWKPTVMQRVLCCCCYLFFNVSKTDLGNKYISKEVICMHKKLRQWNIDCSNIGKLAQCTSPIHGN